MLKQKEAINKFLERINKFQDLVITDNQLTIIPLKSIEDFKEEGDKMHHCVFTNEYWKRENSLILSARIEDKRIETVEVNLKTLRVVQSQGVLNHDTKYHDRIIGLVTKNMNLIRQKLTA